MPFSGLPTRFVSESEPIGGLAADRTGALYYALEDSGLIRRVPERRHPRGLRLGAAIPGSAAWRG